MLNTLMVQSRKNGAVHHMEIQQEWLTVEQAAAIMGVTGAGVRLMCKHQRIKAQKFGHVWMVDKHEAENYTRFKPGPKSKSK